MLNYINKFILLIHHNGICVYNVPNNWLREIPNSHLPNIHANAIGKPCFTNEKDSCCLVGNRIYCYASGINFPNLLFYCNTEELLYQHN